MTAPARTPRQRRRDATRAEILDAAWEVAREDGLASLSLRALATRVGMQAPSLYSYFESKNAIYDAMFQQGQRDLGVHMAGAGVGPPDRGRFRAGTRRWFEFCTADPVRYQLLFQRTIPGFEPSPESFALAVEHLETLRVELAEIGVTDPAAVDIYTALLTGLTSQQLSNDPGGDRWARVLDQSIDMFLDHVGAEPTDSGETP